MSLFYFSTPPLDHQLNAAEQQRKEEQKETQQRLNTTKQQQALRSAVVSRFNAMLKQQALALDANTNASGPGSTTHSPSKKTDTAASSQPKLSVLNRPGAHTTFDPQKLKFTPAAARQTPAQFTPAAARQAPAPARDKPSPQNPKASEALIAQTAEAGNRKPKARSGSKEDKEEKRKEEEERTTDGALVAATLSNLAILPVLLGKHGFLGDSAEDASGEGIGALQASTNTAVYLEPIDALPPTPRLKTPSLSESLLNEIYAALQTNGFGIAFKSAGLNGVQAQFQFNPQQHLTLTFTAAPPGLSDWLREQQRSLTRELEKRLKKSVQIHFSSERRSDVAEQGA